MTRIHRSAAIEQRLRAFAYVRNVYIHLELEEYPQEGFLQLLESDFHKVANLLYPSRLELNLANLSGLCDIVHRSIPLDRLRTLVLTGREQSWAGAAYILRFAVSLVEITLGNGAGCIREQDTCRDSFTFCYPRLRHLKILSIT